ncbi:hypothetical protein ROZALSC1DRAFT_31204 [Rozella allomycis CSF55]|uniref:WD40 repeat-like protein n=1 Tax=Rozella allomycis (strain CSF55) TaxID=988480 RepID=A0A075ATL1_ROZAC|nr:hypothetical protein O9G_003602 [Rozella allomycis CSF55]RKP16952.1 hypothetical protein ROZALSC1DRAFT_31204 [Rozella allomycis CSF55]|eukprot:EPZ31892.1 hypothetical protein O9G_003602 [Rozella allomycis CSF55]
MNVWEGTTYLHSRSSNPYNMNSICIYKNMLFKAFKDKIDIFQIEPFLFIHYRDYSSTEETFTDSEIHQIKLGNCDEFEYLVAVKDDGNVIVFLIESNFKAIRFNTGESTWGIATSKKYVAVSSNDFKIRIFDLITNETILLVGHCHNIPAIGKTKGKILHGHLIVMKLLKENSQLSSFGLLYLN